MIKKMKWIDLLSNLPVDEIRDSVFDDILSECDSLFSEKLSTSEEITYENESLQIAYSTMFDSFFESDETKNIWAELPIFVSSFKEKDERIFYELNVRLFQYLGFYKRILIDDGVARKVLTHRTYSGSGTSDGTYKDYESETPQIQLTNFDDAINYASRLGKNVDSRSTSKEGESDYELKSFNWDEALKNMKMVFYNDLIRYINSIPLLVYNYYSLEQIPVIESVKQYFEQMKVLREMYARR